MVSKRKRDTTAPFGGAENPSFPWGDNRYRLISLGPPGGVTELPGEDVSLGTREVLVSRYTLVFGEPGAGSRAFVEWWCGVLDREDGPRSWVLARGTPWGLECQRGPNPEVQDGGEKIRAAGAVSDPGEGSRLLADWAAGLPGPCTLVLRDFMSLGGKRALVLATSVRRVLEEGRCPELRFLIISTAEGVFMDLPERSGLWPLCQRYRFASWSKDEVARLAGGAGAQATGRPLVLEPPALDALWHHTGGQPLLVQDLLRRLRELRLTQTEPLTADQVEANAAQQRRFPPEKTQLWKGGLHDLLVSDPELARDFGSYVAGATLGPTRFPRADGSCRSSSRAG